MDNVNMSTSFLIGMACLFFVIGHSTLVHFLIKESPSRTIINIIFPWPRNGKSIPILCLLISLLCVFLLIITPGDFMINSKSGWKLIFIFAVFPIVFYVLYIAKRIYKETGSFIFRETEFDRTDWVWPLILSVTISVVFWFIK